MKVFNDLVIKFEQRTKQAPQPMNLDAPDVVASMAANHFKENFQTGSLNKRNRRN